jgi:hypothetical protein
MGSMSFLLPNPLPGAAVAALKGACIKSSVHFYDQTPVPTAARVENGSLILTRDQRDSGALSVPWPVHPYGTLLLSSATVRERAEPYRLLVELARGKLNQVRGQLAEWRGIGLQTSHEFDTALAEATRSFARAALSESATDADAEATRALEQAHQLAAALVNDYVEQICATRHHAGGPLPTRFAARFAYPPRGPEFDLYSGAFNAASVAFRWRDVEPSEAQYDWAEADSAVATARAAGMPVTIGPLIDLAPGMLPPWASRFEADLPGLAAFMCDYVETVVTRYRGDVRRWIVCAGFNQADAYGHVDDDRLRLAYRLYVAAAQVDGNLELVLSLAQPWGEYLAKEDQTISPITFPDDLVRAGVRLSALELELRTAVHPRGSFNRDLLDTAKLLDTFAMLGLPLEVVLGLPSSADPDPRAAAHGQEVWLPGWPGAPTPDAQAAWGESVARLALALPQVRAVTWDHWTDAEAHVTPNGGLLDAAGHPKPLLDRFRALRAAHLPALAQ